MDIAPAIGAQLAYYKGANGPGVFAPAGWHCRQWYGSNGSFIAVTPAAPPDRFPPKRIGERMVEFSTPPRRAGFGTQGLLQESDEPISGIVALDPRTQETALSVLWVRLRAGQESLSATITGLEAACLKRLEG